MLADAVVGTVNLAVQREEQGHGVFGDGMRRIGGNPHDANPEGGGGLEIDLVESRAAKRDDLDTLTRETLEAGPVDLIVHKNTDGPAARDSGGIRGREPEVVENVGDPRVGGGLQKKFLIVGLGIVESDLHHGKHLVRAGRGRAQANRGNEVDD